MSKCMTIFIVAICICTGDSTSCNDAVKLSYTDGDMYMTVKSKYTFTGKPKDCAELYLMGHHESGVYSVWPANRLFENKSLKVFCDMDTNGGGWTVIQRRGQFNNPEDYFYKDWQAYKAGFGDIREEFWLGNDIIYALTNQKLYSARFDFSDVDDETAFAEYDTFWIDDENHEYKLHVAGYTGTAGDSIAGYHNNQKFSTPDRENDSHKDKNCAEHYRGAWWYRRCHTSNLNGLNLRKKKVKPGIGINWKTWRGFGESLESVQIEIRPKDFKPTLLSYNNLRA